MIRCEKNYSTIVQPTATRLRRSFLHASIRMPGNTLGALFWIQHHTSHARSQFPIPCWGQIQEQMPSLWTVEIWWNFNFWRPPWNNFLSVHLLCFLHPQHQRMVALVRCAPSTQNCQLRLCLQQKCPKSKPYAKRVRSCTRKASIPSRWKRWRTPRNCWACKPKPLI